MQRLLQLPSLFILLCLILSCNKDEEKPVRIMPYEIDWEIGAGLNSFETHFFEFYNIQTNVEAHFDGEDLSLNDISRIQGRQATLNLLDQGLTFEDVRTVEVYLVSKSDPSREYEVFYTLDLQKPSERRQNIRLIPTLTNIKPLYFHETMDVVVRLNFWRVSRHNLPVRLEWELEAIE